MRRLCRATGSFGGDARLPAAGGGIFTRQDLMTSLLKARKW